MGYLYAAASSLSMALMLLSAKVIAQGLGSFLGAFVRGISMFLINYILMKRDSVNYYAHSSEGIQPFIVVEKLLLKRAIFGGLTMVFICGTHRLHFHQCRQLAAESRTHHRAFHGGAHPQSN